MSIRRMISIDVSIQDFMENVEMQDDRFRPKLTRWAIDAERKIGSFYSYKRDYVKATRCDSNHYEIPCHVVGVLGLMLGCVSQNECGKIFRNQYNYYGSSNNVFDASYFMIGVDGSFNRTGASRMWEIQDNKIVFMYPQNIAEITLDCITYQIDDRGFPLINENHRDAIATYLEMMWMKQAKHVPSMQQYSLGESRDEKSEWDRKCRLARGQDGEPTASQMGELVSMYNNPLSGASGIVWRYADEYYWTWR